MTGDMFSDEVIIVSRNYYVTYINDESQSIQIKRKKKKEHT